MQSRGQDTLSTFRTHKNALARQIDSFISRFHLSSGELLISQGDSIIYEQYKGFANKKNKERITASTPFHIASTSKTFTGMAILKLQQDSLLNINDPVDKYIEGFPYKAVSIYHLLTHRSGIPYYANFLPRSRKKYYSNKDMVAYILRHKPRLLFKPDSRFKYCNTNYALLAYIIEEVTKTTYETYLQRTFWTPYQFEKTFVMDAQEKLPKATPSYTYRNRRYGVTSLDFIYGDKNVYSTVRDLNKWNKVLNDTTLFHPTTLNLAYSVFSPFETKKKSGVPEKMKGYGLGWRIFYTDNYYKVVYHNGWWHGNKSLFLRIPDLNYCIVALNNTSSSSVYNLRRIIPILTHSDYQNEEEDIIDKLNIEHTFSDQ